MNHSYETNYCFYVNFSYNSEKKNMNLLLYLLLLSYSKSQQGQSLQLLHNSPTKCNWNNFLKIMNEHLNLNRETYIIYDIEMKYRNQLIQLIHLNLNERMIVSTNSTIITTNPSSSNNHKLPREDGFNIIYLLTNLNQDLFLDLFTNVIFFMDSSIYENIETMNFYPKYKYVLRNIFYLQNLSECDDGSFKLWVNVFGKKGKYIPNLQKAYFNRKPNYYGLQVAYFQDYSERFRGYKYVRFGKDRAIQQYLKENWNATIPVNLNTNRAERFLEIIVDEYAFAFTTRGDPYYLTSYCFVLHKSKEYPPWQAVIRSFEWSVWIGCAVTLLATILSYAFIIQIQQNSIEEHKMKIIFECFCKMLSLLVSEPIYWMNTLQKFPNRILTVSVMLGSFILIYGYQSCFYSLLQAPGRYPPVNSISEFENNPRIIHCTHTFICYQLFSNGPIELKQLVKYIHSSERHSHPRPTNVTLNDIYLNPNSALVMSCEKARRSLSLIRKYSNSLHIMAERITMYPLFIRSELHEGFAYYEEFRRMVATFYESGIAQWLDEKYEMEKLIKLLIKNRYNPEKVKTFNLNDLQIGFILLIIGYILATFVFILEINIYLY